MRAAIILTALIIFMHIFAIECMRVSRKGGSSKRINPKGEYRKGVIVKRALEEGEPKPGTNKEEREDCTVKNLCGKCQKDNCLCHIGRQ